MAVSPIQDILIETSDFRLSVGLEAVEDIIAGLSQALEEDTTEKDR